MMKIFGAAVAAACMTVAGLAPAQAQNTTGVTDTEIHIGHTSALSGPLSIISNELTEIYKKFFDRVNASGGINGRKIVFHVADDAYNPAKTVEQTRKLVERDNVLLMLAPFGTPTAAAAAPYLNDAGVPQLFIGSGSLLFNNSQKYPWSVPQLPNNFLEGKAYGKYLAQEPETAKIGVMYQNDDFGKEILAGLKEGLGARASAIVAEVTYEPSDATVDSQVIALQGSGANIFVNISVGRPTVQSIVKAYDSGWKPKQILASALSGMADTLKAAGFEKAKGIVTAQYLKDPADPTWANDEGLKSYREFMAAEMPKSDAGRRAPLGVYVVSQVFTDVLKSLGKDVSRESVIQAVTHLNGVENAALRPGSTITTTPEARNLFRQRYLVQFDGEKWVELGDYAN